MLIFLERKLVVYIAIPLYFVNFPFHYLFRACKIRNWNELIFCNFVLGSRRRTGNYDNLLWSSLLIGPKGTMKFGTVNKNFHTKGYHTILRRWWWLVNLIWCFKHGFPYQSVSHNLEMMMRIVLVKWQGYSCLWWWWP